MRRLFSPLCTTPLYATVLVGGLLVAFSVLQSGCTNTPTSQASEPVSTPASFLATTVEKPIESDFVTTVQPADLLKILPLAKTTPVFIDFTSEYCGECKAIAPVIAAAKKRYANKVTFIMIDVQQMMDSAEKTEGRALMMAFRPMYTPTLVAIKPGGIVVAVETGFQTSPQLDVMLGSSLPTVKKTLKTAS